ncbi:MAG: flagellar protein FlaG [Treponema sp.]|nr:flagellar protein FlaG [Treponema sp.]
MNTISNLIGQNLAMDGQNYFKVAPQSITIGTGTVGVARSVPGGAEVAHNIAQNIAEVKENAQQLQRLSEMVMGRRSLRFSVNEELGDIVISVLDPSTNKVIKQIPSEEIQKMKVSMKKAIGLLFDEMI